VSGIFSSVEASKSVHGQQKIMSIYSIKRRPQLSAAQESKNIKERRPRISAAFIHNSVAPI